MPQHSLLAYDVVRSRQTLLILMKADIDLQMRLIFRPYCFIWFISHLSSGWTGYHTYELKVQHGVLINGSLT